MRVAEPGELFGIRPAALDSIRDLARRHGVRRVVLYGSRARQEHGEKSDIDLALVGGDQARFYLDVEEEAPTLLFFDVVDLDKVRVAPLGVEIERDGVVLYEEVR